MVGRQRRSRNGLLASVVSFLVGDARDGVFSEHVVDTTAIAGKTLRVQFWQHTNVPGKGFFTLVDDMQLSPKRATVAL